MLTAATTETDYVEAKDGRRGVAYVCRGCGDPVILHAGHVRPWHFQHHPDGACPFGSKMSEAHLDCQRAIAASLRARGAHVELESWLPGLTGDRRIDVLTHPAADPGRRIAVEVQQADLTVEAIQLRTQAYRKAEVAPFWLRLRSFDKFESVQRVAATGEIWIERYPARAWERWIHDTNGAVWFCDAGTGLVWRGRFLPAYGWRDSSEWYETGGAHNYYPGGWTPVTRWVGLLLEGAYPLQALRLTRTRAKDRGLAAAFVRPDGAAEPPPARHEARSELRGTYLVDVCALEHQVEGGWAASALAPAATNWRRALAPMTEAAA